MGQMVSIPAEDYFLLVEEASCWRAILSVARSGKQISPDMVLVLEESNKQDMKKEESNNE